MSQRVEKEPYLLAALVLFLTEVIIRRMKDYRKERLLSRESAESGARGCSYRKCCGIGSLSPDCLRYCSGVNEKFFALSKGCQ